MQTHTYYDLCDVQGHPSPVALASMHDLDGAQLARLHSRAVMAGHATVADEIRAETERRILAVDVGVTGLENTPGV